MNNYGVHTVNFAGFISNMANSQTIDPEIKLSNSVAIFRKNILIYELRTAVAAVHMCI